MAYKILFNCNGLSSRRLKVSECTTVTNCDGLGFMKSGSVIPIPAQRKAERNSLSVHPNPAKDYFIVKYELDNNYAEAVIDIMDITGRNVNRFSITMMCDYLVVSTMELNNGMYVVKLILNGQEVGTQKVNIQK